MIEDHLRLLATTSHNFGFLVDVEPLLAVDGASAESQVYVDPNSTLSKSRRFGEVMAKKVAAMTSSALAAKTQDERIRALAVAGVISAETADRFHALRQEGNKAVHTHYGDVRIALTALNHCYVLGQWFCHLVTGRAHPGQFVPPAQQVLTPPTDPVLRTDFLLLQKQIDAYRQQMTNVEESQQSSATKLDDLHRVISALDSRMEELRSMFDATLDQAAGMTPGQHAWAIQQARAIAGFSETDDGLQTSIDQLLHNAGWKVARGKPRKNTDAIAIASDAGDLRYRLYLNGALVASLAAVDSHSDLPAHGSPALTDTAFAYLTSEHETLFANQTLPEPVWQRVFGLHSPATLRRMLDPQRTKPPSASASTISSFATAGGVAISAGGNVYSNTNIRNRGAGL